MLIFRGKPWNRTISTSDPFARWPKFIPSFFGRWLRPTNFLTQKYYIHERTYIHQHNTLYNYCFIAENYIIHIKHINLWNCSTRFNFFESFIVTIYIFQLPDLSIRNKYMIPENFVLIILTWHRRYCDHEGSAPRTRLSHCTLVGLTLAITPNVGNSGA